VADLNLLLEAERRGILPQNKQEMLNEARRRGLIGGGQQTAEQKQFDPNEGQSIANQLLVGVGRSAAKTGNALQDFALTQAQDSSQSLIGRALNTNPIGRAVNFINEKALGALIPNAAELQREGRESAAAETSLFDQNASGLNKVGEIVGDIAQFAAPGAALSKGVQGLGLASRLASQGALAGGIDRLQQQGEGATEADLTRTALAASLGAGGELAAPLVGKAAQAIGRAFRGGSNDTLEAGRVIASQIQGGDQLSDDLLRQVGARFDEFQAGASPQSLLGEVEQGFRFTRGQQTGDFRQLSQEEAVRSSPSSAFGARIRDVEQQNRGQLEEGVNRLVDRFSGGQSPNSPAEALAAVAGSVREQAGQLKSAVNDAFDAFRELDGTVSADAMSGLGQRVRGALSDFDITPDERATNRVLELVDELSSGDITVRDFAKVRRLINSRVGAAESRLDRSAALSAKRELDGFFDDLTDQALISGDAQAVEQLKRANGLRREFGKRFESRSGRDQAGRLVESMVSGEASPEQLANTALGASQVSKVAGANFVQAIKRALGDDEAALGQVKAAVIQGATQNKTGGAVGPQQIANNLKSLLRNRPALVGELFSQEEVAQLQRFTQAIDPLIRRGDFARTSGTAERLLRSSEFQRIVPFIGRALTSARDALAGSRALSPLRPSTRSGFVGGASGSFGDESTNLITN